VKNLTPWVSNELLEKAFSVFGEVSWIPVNSSYISPPVTSLFARLKMKLKGHHFDNLRWSRQNHRQHHTHLQWLNCIFFLY
jgi:hypothetical protein